MSAEGPLAPDLAARCGEQERRVMGLRVATFQRADAGWDQQFEPLVGEEKQLLELRRALVDATRQAQPPAPAKAAVGTTLGAATTGLTVETTLCMSPLPTGVYHLLDPSKEPLLKVRVVNSSHKRRRVRARVGIEGLSADSVQTCELDRLGTAEAERQLSFLPTMLPGALAGMNEVQRATIYVVSEDIDERKVETHDTYAIVCLSRNSSFNCVRDPATSELRDFSPYYGAWVTPYDELVQAQIRDAAGLCQPRQLWGYQGEESRVLPQVKALYESLKQHGIVYVNSVIDYGAPEGYFTQRTRLPREALASRSANCIDGTVLMASLLEGISLNPALVLVPGHAFVAWETWSSSGHWRCLETTMIGERPFEEACEAGQRLYESYGREGQGLLKLHSLRDLRRRGIWPMA